MHFYKKLCVTLFLVLFAMYKINAQEKVILKEYIPKLEQHFGITFSYLEQNANREIMPLNLQGHSLLSILNKLEKQTKLRFQQVSEKYISIRSLRVDDSVSICGYIKDQFNYKVTKQQLVINTAAGDVITLDENDYFIIDKIDYGSHITIEGENYSLRTVTVKELFKQKCPTITVFNNEVKLDEVVVGDYLSPGFEHIDQKVVFTPSNFEVLAGLSTPDIMQAVQQIPGVISPFESASRIFIRGGTPDQNLVRWNGINTYNQSHFFGLLSAFNPSVIDEVDFYKKSISPKYGGRVGGLIDMNTSNEVNNEFKGGIGTNLLHADFFAKIPIIKDHLSVTLSGRRSFTDLWASPTYSQLSERVFQNTRIENAKEGEDEFYFYDSTLSLQAKLGEKDKVQGNLLVSKNDLNFSSSQQSNSQNDNLITQNLGYSMQWDHQFSKKLDAKLNVYNSAYTLDYSFIFQDDNDQNANSRTNFVNDLGLETEFNLEINSNNHITTGVAYSENLVRYAFETEESGIEILLDQDRNVLQTTSGFVDYIFQKTNNLKFNLGVRANRYSTSSEFFLEPRIYLEKQLGKHFSINGSYNRQTQSVTQIRESEFSTIALENLVWGATDDDLEIIKSNHYNLGGAFKVRKWVLEADAYFKEIDNIATFSSGFLNILNNNRSIGESRTLGGEVFLKHKFSRFESWLSYSYVNQKNRFESLNSGRFFRSNINIEHTLKWVTLFQWKQWHFSTSWLLHSGKATAEAKENEKVEGQPLSVDFSNIESGNLPIYHRLDASLKYDFKRLSKKSPQYEVGLSLKNLYNFKETINREFRFSPGVDNELLTFDYTSLGITPNLSFRVTW